MVPKFPDRLDNYKITEKLKPMNLEVQKISPPQDSVPLFLVPTEQFHCQHSATLEELAYKHTSLERFTWFYKRE